MSNSPVRESLVDVRTMLAVVDAGVPVSNRVLDGVWKWYLDVDLPLPLPDMQVPAQERAPLAHTILSEMVSELGKLDSRLAAMSPSEYEDVDISAVPEAAVVNGLWRELASLYAGQINSMVPSLPPEFYDTAVRAFRAGLCDQLELTPEELRKLVRSDAAMRLMLRRGGINPSDI